ncbi:hypothetical protein Y1Q_0014796 [Alligator mississippiensis]|uniref:DDE Tnp4 domain-containing protein n=1 Tax=Alligator mississippiensis TaxID=8496 RepID=A0A151M1Y4_ALLMI|nr:hypothetical protein Y1Q_0014796 [Alligator mississippiensis]
MLSQGRCCCTGATWTPSSWLDPTRDAAEGLLDATVVVPLAIVDQCGTFMYPYTSQLDPCQAHINWCLGQTCALVECTFGHLKGCWCTLTTRLKFAEDSLPQVAVAACVLHNVREVKQELFYEGRGDEVVRADDAWQG